MVNQKVCKKKYLSWVYCVDRKIRHSGSLFGLVMPISDSRDRLFFYPHHTFMKDTYISTPLKIEQILSHMEENMVISNICAQTVASGISDV